MGIGIIAFSLMGYILSQRKIPAVPLNTKHHQIYDWKYEIMFFDFHGSQASTQGMELLIHEKLYF